MKAAFVITLMAAINYARTVHTKDRTNLGWKQSHSSGGESSQSLAISSRVKPTNDKRANTLDKRANNTTILLENVSAPILPGPYEMDMLNGSDLNENESFMLVPLKTLVRYPRKPRDTKSEDEKDPLYVIIPYKELSHSSEDLREPINMISMGDKIAVKRSAPHDASSFENVRQRRKTRSIARARNLSKRRGVVERSFNHPFLNNHEEDVIAQVADSETLWEVPLAKFLKSNRSPYSLAQIPKATYKSKKSLGVNQLPQELFSSFPQKAKVLTEFRGLNFPKSKEVPSIQVLQPRKASNGPVNITMYISNLIPPSEVDNTKITNSGKLFKSGCLKFSIQLDKPNGLPSDDCCMEECCNACKSTTCTPLLPPKLSCSHLERISEEKHMGSVNPLSCNASCDNTARSQAQGRGQSTNSENAQSSAAGGGKGPAAHASKCPMETSSRIENNQAANRDATSLLMQLMGLDKKSSARKPVQPSPAQAVLMDSDIVKELQRLLTSSNQGSMTVTSDAPRSNYPISQTRIGQHNPKAKVIADALNLFSKFTSVRQPLSQK